MERENDSPPAETKSNTKQYDYLFKLVLIGDSGVGKSSLLIRFADDNFSTQFISTIGIDYRFKTITIDGKNVRLQVWDTAGQERFRSITPGYYQSADGIIMAYAINDLSSFEHIEEWLDDVRKHAQPNINVILVGNKCDLESERQVSLERTLSLSNELHLRYVEASAKESTRVNDAFVQLATDLVRARSGKPQDNKKHIKLAASGTKSSGGCC